MNISKQNLHCINKINFVSLGLLLLLLIAIVVLTIGGYILGKVGFINLLIPVTFGTITAFFSLLAYRHTREQFRLKLFDKRLVYYESLISCLSDITITYGEHLYDDTEISKRIHESANNSLRGMGYHSGHFLFGENIHILLNDINNSVNFLIANQFQKNIKADEWAKHITFLNKTIKELPYIFSKYLNFKDY